MNSPVAWALVFHILGLVFWMTGLLATTTVLAAHTREKSAEARSALKRLEARLLKGSAHPGAALNIVAGIVILWIQPGYLRQHWLHAKLFLVAILIGLDIMVYLRTRAYHAGEVELRTRECMIFHGAISLVFLGIVILVMIKPF
jgi:putative membrane protein